MNENTNTQIVEKGIISSKQNHIESIFLFIIFPLCQMLLFFLTANGIYELYSIPVPWYYTLLTLICLLVIVISFLFYRLYIKKNTQKKYAELSSLQAYQKNHYDNIEVQRKRMRILTNDYQIRLNHISALLTSTRSKEALTLLEDLVHQVNSTKEYSFCPSPIINAVLSDKELACKQASIPFQADLNIGACNTIPPVYLCNIFSNLLDNAIAACHNIEDISKRYIHVTAKQAGDYLHIKVTNSASSLENPKDGHGYGQKILKDITEKYHGNFQTHYENGTYETYLSLQFPEEGR